MSKPEEFKFDTRVRERFLRNRVLSGAEVKKYLSQLPDLEGEYEVAETAQPAVTPARSEIHEEPLVFEGIRRLQALSEAHAAPRPVAAVAAAPREPEPRPLGTPLRSAMMDSQISGVGAGAVSAALEALAAEREASARLSPGLNPALTQAFAQPSSEPEATTPVTLRSEAAPDAADATVESVDPAAVEQPAPDSEDLA